MKTFYFFLALMCTSILPAQNTIPHDTSLIAKSNFAERASLSRVALDNSLATGRSYFVEAPSVEYDVENKKLYHHADFLISAGRLKNGEEFSAMARYQVLNQKFEVSVEKKVFELDTKTLSAITIGEEHFVLLPSIDQRSRKPTIYQVHYIAEDTQLLEHHQAEWKEAQLSAPYGKIEDKRTINRFSDLILIRGGQTYDIRKAKDLTNALQLPKRGEAQDFIKENGLKLNKAVDAARLLSFLGDNQL